MPDNSGREPDGDVWAGDRISDVLHQRVKISVGADGAATDLSAADPMPVVLLGRDSSGALVEAGVDSLGHADVVAHAHAEGGHVYFEKVFSASEDVILIDISDTTNYPHSNTLWIHTANMVLNIDADNTADYRIHIGFIENVDGTDGDFHEILEVSGTKQTGQSQFINIAQNPEAPKLKSSGFLSSSITLNDTAFQTDVNLASTRDPSTANVPSGSGDMIMRVTRNAGSFAVSLMIGYHSHS